MLISQGSKPHPPAAEDRKAIAAEDRKAKAEAEAEEEEMDWDADPENPRNWPWGKKWRVVSVVSVIPSYPA